MELRVTRPGFIRGIQALAAGSAPVPAPREHRALAAGRSRAAVRSERRRLAAGDAVVRLRPVPRRVLLRPEGDAVLPVEQRAEGRADRELLRRLQVPRRPPFYDWTHGETGARRAQGAAPGVRDVEPGHSRAQRRRVRRLPHAVQARGRDEGVGPLGPQPAAEHRRAPARRAIRTRKAEIQARVAAIQDRTHALLNRSAAA